MQNALSPIVLNDLQVGMLSSILLLEQRLYPVDSLKLIRLLKYCGAILNKIFYYAGTYSIRRCNHAILIKQCFDIPRFSYDLYMFWRSC